MAKPRCRMHPEGIGKESMAVACQGQPTSPIIGGWVHGEGLQVAKSTMRLVFGYNTYNTLGANPNIC